MCGICGFNWTDDKLLTRMMKSIEHRGPDQHGKYTDDRITFGHRRLSIIDLSSHGRQPMSNEEGTVWIVFNGEIYNFLELKSLLKKHHEFRSNTDTEVIIHLYEEVGEKVFSMLSGDFAIGIYDLKKKKVFLARDHVGVKPLYYYANNGEFIFCSEIKGILELDTIKREINKGAVDVYLTFRHNFLEETMFQGIYRVLPGSMITYDLAKKTLTKQQYWKINISNMSIQHKDKAALKEEYLNVLFKSVNDRLMGDVPLGVFLSGGIDSSAIVAAMRLQNKHLNIHTYSVGFGYSEEEDELKFAKLVSKKFNTNHSEFIVKSDVEKDLRRIVWLCDEPLADPACIPTYLLSKAAKKSSTVILTGDGGDETFAGYEQYKFLSTMHKFKSIHPLTSVTAPIFLKTTPGFVLNKFFKYASALGDEGRKRAIKMIQKRSTLEKYEEMLGVFDDEEKESILIKQSSHKFIEDKNLKHTFFPNPRKANENYLNQLLRFDLKTILPEGYLMKTDRMCMGWSIEGRVPLLDKRLLEFSFRTPPNYKLKGREEKYLMKESLKDILPQQITQRKKQRFYVPIDKWLRDDLSGLTNIVLDEKKIRKEKIFNYEHIQKIKDKYRTGELYYARQLWSMINFELWKDTFIEDRSKTKHPRKVQ